MTPDKISKGIFSGLYPGEILQYPGLQGIETVVRKIWVNTMQS